MLRRTRMTGIGSAVAVLAAVLTGLPTAEAAPAAEPRVVPIQVTGAPAKRFNLIVLGDGYTAAELPKFRAAASTSTSTCC